MKVGIGGREIDLSNRDKLFFPESGLTKGDLVNYYRGVAGVMVPHMRYYGVSMERYPDGIKGEGFYQKDAGDYFPEWLVTVRIPKREGGSYSAPVVDGEAALAYLADQAVITPHLYLSRTDDLELPDRMIYDLDPPETGGDPGDVRRGALDLKELLDELDISSFVKTTGSRGYHLVVPLKRGPGFDTVRDFAAGAARVLVKRYPKKYTLEQRKEKRKGRVFLDTLRNSYGATAVSPYAVRALPGAPVATPISWDELRRGASPADWDISSIPGRLARKEDPWRHIRRHGISLESRKESLHRLLQEAD